MKITTVYSLVFVLILCSLSSVYASNRDKNITPMLSILLAAPKLPPGTKVFPETGAMLVRYDRTNSTDWIEFVGTEESGKPSFPLTQMRGNVRNNSFTITWDGENPVQFIYPIWTIDISYDANNNPTWTIKTTSIAANRETLISLRTSTVDCTKPRSVYEAALIEAEALKNTFLHLWKETIVCTSGGIGATWSHGATQILEISKDLGFVYKMWSKDPLLIMPFVEKEIEATEMLASYDMECNAEPCADRGLPGPEIVTWKGHEWQRCDDGKQYHWEEAKTFCADLYLGGYTDWHLPTKEELKSLVVCTNGTATPLADYPSHPYSCPDGNHTPYERPTINAQFSCQTGSYYWSSNVYDEDEAWIVFFYYGNSGGHLRENSSFVRCVRTTILN